MGMTATYKCQSCGLSAKVSGGRDVGKYASTQTVWCAHCREIQDVMVRHQAGFGRRCKFCDAMPNIRRAPDTDIDKAIVLHDDTPRCFTCGTQRLQAWNSKDPCPACSGEIAMDQDAGIVMWE